MKFLTIWMAASCILLSTSSVRGQTNPDAPQGLHLFLLAGQSNMAGRGKIEEQDRQSHPRIMKLDNSGQWVPASDPLHFDKPKLVGVGPGKSFALQYVEANPGVTVGLVPCAVGGSPIQSWTPGGVHQQTGLSPYDDAVKRIEIAKQSGSFQGILWHQGESDCKPELVTQYEAGLVNTLDRLRSCIGDPNLPILIGGLGDFQLRPWDASRRKIDEIHKIVCQKLPFCEFVSSLGLTSKSDNVHFDAASCRAFGKRYFQAYERVTSQAVPRLETVTRIWDQAAHCAFTDLTYFDNAFYCVFREAARHVSPDGSIRVLRSSDGANWHSLALLSDPNNDLRDPKLTVTPGSKLMLTAAAAIQRPDENGKPQTVEHQTQVWFSADGISWSEPHPIGKRNDWLWRTTWQNSQAYAVGYHTGGAPKGTTLYRSKDGSQFEPLLPSFFDEGYPNESALTFVPNGVAYCLLRRDPRGDSGTAQLGKAYPPYEEWIWQDLGTRIGGPVMTMTPDGRLLAVVRLYDGHTRTSLCQVDPHQGKLHELLRLPSGGDTSYAGIVVQDDTAWISYYSSHERGENEFDSAIYLAQVSLP